MIRGITILGMVVLSTIPSVLQGQAPFSLDMSFRAQFNDWYVSDILPLEDGKLIVSGQTGYPGAPPFTFHGVNRLGPDGSFDPTFNPSNLGRGKMVRSGDAFYVASNTIVRRLLLNGQLDPTWSSMNSSPYFSSLQGGDYHVYPDGSLLVSGAHSVNLPDSGWSGLYNLIWFTNTGRLDSTRAPRKGNGVIYDILELPDGKFMCTGPMTVFEGQPTSYIFRVHADGSLDTTFQTGTFWGQAYAFLPLDDGRCYVGGTFKRSDTADTLQLVRLLPSGALDPTFNNNLRFGIAPPITWQFGIGVVSSITRLDEGRLIVTGTFRDVDGAQRGSIALVDTTGQLLDDHFNSPGCGPHTYQGFTDAAIQDILFTNDGMAYIWGDYHGYNDGTTSDPLQRFVTRLYGPDFSTHMQEVAPQRGAMRLAPNPAHAWVAISWQALEGEAPQAIELRDMLGRPVERAAANGVQGQVVWDLRNVPAGTYVVVLQNTDGNQLATERLIVQP